MQSISCEILNRTTSRHFRKNTVESVTFEVFVSVGEDDNVAVIAADDDIDNVDNDDDDNDDDVDGD